MNKQQIETKIKKLQKKLKEIKEKEESIKDKPIYTKIPELGIEVSQKIYNNKTYSEILKIVKEEQIVTSEMLFKLRKLTKKYPQFLDFWVFVPNPDVISKENNYVAWFDAGAGRADLVCGRDPSDRVGSLGVFLWRKLRIKPKKLKEKERWAIKN